MNVLAIGAHPDDIEFGCGGMLAKYARRGHAVFMFVASDGALGGDPEVRRREQAASAKILGVREVHWGGYADTEVPLTRELIACLEKVMREVDPRMIFVNSPDDTHQDHRAMAKCVITASRFMKSVLAFELPTSLDFTPTVFINIADYLDRKEEILKLHNSQMRKNNGAIFCLDEYVRPFAIFRGLQARTKYVEGFAAHRIALDNF